MRPIGILVNPASGRDVRRLLASAGRSTLEEKVSIVQRAVLGAVEAGAERFLFNPEPHGIVRRAVSALDAAARCEPIELEGHYRESDTTQAAEVFRAAGCAVVVVLGGDGTNRAFARGWRDAPLIPLSTGTNNVFPYFAEPTLAGIAAGHLARGALALAAVSRASKLIEVEIEGERGDLALVDALALHERIVGSLAPYEPSALQQGVFARAEPAAIGASAIAGLLEPCPATADYGVHVELSADGEAPKRALRAALAPGYFREVRVRAHRRLALGSEVELTGPLLLAFDGDRRRLLAPGQRARLRVVRSGPLVVDVSKALALAAGRELFDR